MNEVLRKIMLDTETTGLDWRGGHRVIEIGCVELSNRVLTGRHYHVYLNPDRDIDPEAERVHGLSREFLADKPRFADVVDEFLEFICGAELVIHNAGFDLGFLNSEMERIGREPVEQVCDGVLDTVRLAKEQNPGKKASLNALCDRYDINYAHRSLHGALLDAELLAEVYLAMTRGQESLMMALEEETPTAAEAAHSLSNRAPLRILHPSPEELDAHLKVIAAIGSAWAP